MSAKERHHVAGQRTDKKRQKELDFLVACHEGDIASVKDFIRAKVDINATGSYGFEVNSALGLAASEGHLEIVKILLTAGIDVNKRNKDGITVGGRALLDAALHGHSHIVNVLIKARVALKEEDNYGRTVGEKALEKAAFYGHLDFVKELIKAGVEIKQETKDGNTVGGKALVSAALYGHLDIVKVLITAGVDVKKEDKDGNTIGGKAVVKAVLHGHLDIVNVLIKAGVDLKKELKDQHGNTVGGKATEEAALRGHLGILNVLITAGVDLNKTDEHGNTDGGKALVQATASGHINILNGLITAGVDVNKEDGDGNTVGGKSLVEAAFRGRLDIVNLLITAGVDVKREHQNGTVGESALCEMLESGSLHKGHIKIVDTFVRQEVHMNKKDKFIEICKRNIQEAMQQKVRKENIALNYKLYELFTGKTKEIVLEEMTRDMEQIKDPNYKSKYKAAISYYKDDIPKIITEVRLNEEQKMQMVEAFASGTEKDFCVRSNFVGFTGAGKTSLMWQLFLIIFSPSDIESTNGIDISLGYCSIDLLTKEWKRHEESAEVKRARRFEGIADASKAQKSESNKSYIENIYTRTNPGTKTQQKQQQQREINDNLLPQQKRDTTRKPTNVPVTKTRISSTAEPSTTKTDPNLIHRRITQGKSKAGRRKEEANATGIDYAGQATYYSLHQLFLSKRGVNIIVLDGSKDFDEAICDEDARHIRSKEKADSKDFFRFWANSLRYYLPERTSQHIITVFTHKDLVVNQDDLQTKKSIVKEMIDEMGMTELFFETIFCVNANDPNDKVLQEIRHVILEFSTREPHWGRKMPSRWLLLEDKLMQRKTSGQQVMTLDEVNEMHLKSALPLDSQDELLLFLKIHHEIGTLMHFADEGITKIVILNPQWLIDSLKMVICAKQFRDPQYKKQWDRLHEKGVVDKSFLYNVWKSRTQERFYEFREDLILLMNKLDLISSPKTYGKKGDYVQSPYFIVPCMLHSAPENFLKKYQNKATHRNLPLAFEFQHRFLPTATAYRMLATCVMEFGEMKDEEKIYCDAAVFKVFEHHYLTLEFTSSSIIANVLTFGKTRASNDICKGVREFLEDALKCILSSQRVPTNYSLLVACGYEDKNDKPVWLKWSSVMEKPEIICDKHKNERPHVVKTEQILKHWSLVRYERHVQSKRRTIHKKPTPDETPDHRCLGRISRRIPSKGYHILFINLGLTTIDIERIESYSVKQRILLLLLEWAKGPSSTYKQLADTLHEQERYVLDIEEMLSHNCEWRAEIPKACLGKEVASFTDLEFDHVCRFAGSSYLELGLELGLMKHEIDIIEMDNRKCYSITRDVIKSWIDKTIPDDTWDVLGDALYEIGVDPHLIKGM